MKRSRLFLSFLILFATCGASVSYSSDPQNKDGEQERLARSMINKILLLSGGGAVSNAGGEGTAGGGGSGSTGGGPGGSGTGAGTGSGGIPSDLGPNVIVVQAANGQILYLTKLNSNGQELAASSEDWSCLKDNSNNLIWEVKTQNGDLHDQQDSFSWFNTNLAGYSDVGLADNSGATCEGYVAGDPSTYCNTQAYVSRVNSSGLCGQQNWRLPTIDELKGLVSLNRAAPELYTRLFPRGTGTAVWSATPHAFYSRFAWHIYVNDGYAHGNDKSGNLPVLLVRNAQ